MANEPVAPAGTPATGTPAVESGFDPSKYVAREDFDRLQHQLNGISAALRTLPKAQPQITQQATEPTENQKVTLASLKAQMDTDREALQRDAWTIELNGLATKAGIPEDRVELLELYVEKHHKSQITVEGRKVFYTDELGDKKPFAHLFQKISASKIGQTLLPPVETPGQVGNRNSQGVIRSSGKDISQMSIDDMIKDPKGADAAMVQMFQGIAQGQLIRT